MGEGVIGGYVMFCGVMDGVVGTLIFGMGGAVKGF
jgi:hypothetical protein